MIWIKGSKGGHNYIEYLKSTPDSSVEVTGSLLEPEDRMQITLMSKFLSDCTKLVLIQVTPICTKDGEDRFFLNSGPRLGKVFGVGIQALFNL